MPNIINFNACKDCSSIPIELLEQEVHSMVPRLLTLIDICHAKENIYIQKQGYNNHVRHEISFNSLVTKTWISSVKPVDLDPAEQ